MLLGFSALCFAADLFHARERLQDPPEYLGNRIGPPLHPVLSSLAEAMAGGDLYSWLLNSFLVTALSVGISTALAALAAYPLSLMRWRARAVRPRPR